MYTWSCCLCLWAHTWHGLYLWFSTHPWILLLLLLNLVSLSFFYSSLLNVRIKYLLSKVGIFFFVEYYLGGWKMCMATSCKLMECSINSWHSSVLTFFWHKVYSLRPHVVCGFVRNHFCISFLIMQKWSYLQQRIWNLAHGRV
jgi:hypothetical protein